MFRRISFITYFLISNWEPKEKYSKENQYRDDLCDFLRRAFDENYYSMFDIQENINVRKKTGKESSDIEINENEVGIELKKDLIKKKQVNRLIEKIVGYRSKYNDIIVVLVGNNEKNAFEHLKDRISDLNRENRVRFLDKKQDIEIINKGKKIYRKTEEDDIFKSLGFKPHNITCLDDILQKYQSLIYEIG